MVRRDVRDEEEEEEVAEGSSDDWRVVPNKQFSNQINRKNQEKLGHTSEIVFNRVNGINRNPTPVLAVLPTNKSPAVVNFIFPPGF